MLCSSTGFGDTVSEARDNYVLQIRGKRLVVNAYSEDRDEYIIPEDLT